MKFAGGELVHLCITLSRTAAFHGSDVSAVTIPDDISFQSPWTRMAMIGYCAFPTGGNTINIAFVTNTAVDYATDSNSIYTINLLYTRNN